MTTNATGLTLFKDVCIYIYAHISAFFKRAVRTSSSHRNQEFSQNISKSLAIQSRTGQTSLALSVKQRYFPTAVPTTQKHKLLKL